MKAMERTASYIAVNERLDGGPTELKIGARARFAFSESVRSVLFEQCVHAGPLAEKVSDAGQRIEEIGYRKFHEVDLLQRLAAIAAALLFVIRPVRAALRRAHSSLRNLRGRPIVRIDWRPGAKLVAHLVPEIHAIHSFRQ